MITIVSWLVSFLHCHMTMCQITDVDLFLNVAPNIPSRLDKTKL